MLMQEIVFIHQPIPPNFPQHPAPNTSLTSPFLVRLSSPKREPLKELVIRQVGQVEDGDDAFSFLSILPTGVSPLFPSCFQQLPQTPLSGAKPHSRRPYDLISDSWE